MIDPVESKYISVILLVKKKLLLRFLLVSVFPSFEEAFIYVRLLAHRVFIGTQLNHHMSDKKSVFELLQ